MSRAPARVAITLLIAAFPFAAAGLPSSLSESADASEGRLVIVPSAAESPGEPARFSVTADGVDLRELLAALFRKTGDEFVIRQDVVGPITLALRDATADEVLRRIQAAAYPPIRVERGKVTVVSLAPGTQGVGAQPSRRPGLPAPPAAPGGYGPMLAQQQALSRPVTLDIANDRPIPLGQAVRDISQQTQVPIRLDPRIPQNVGFAAQFTRIPLAVALDWIARTGAFQWLTQPDGSLLLAPSNALRISLGGTQAFGYPTTPCPRCRRPMLPGWSFCPYDGQVLSRRAPAQRRSQD